VLGIFTLRILVVICAITTFGVVNSVTAQNMAGIDSPTEATIGNCSPYFNRFAPPAQGYKRFMDNTNCNSIDYPENWIVKDPLDAYNVVLTDGEKASVTISQRPAYKADNSTFLTLGDIKTAINNHDTSIPNLASIPGLYDFPYVGEAGGPSCSGCPLDNLPTIWGDTTSDLGYAKVYRNLYATIFQPPPKGPFYEIYVLTFSMDESGTQLPLLRDMVASVRIFH
jgi:hypothetical protein